MNIYLRKILNHDVTHEISVTQEVLKEYFKVEIGSRVNIKGKNSGVQGIMSFNNATDPRLGADIKRIINAENNMEIGDIVSFVKKSDLYEIDLIKPTDERYETFSKVMESERHLIVSVDVVNRSESGESEENKETLFKNWALDNNKVAEVTLNGYCSALRNVCKVSEIENDLKDDNLFYVSGLSEFLKIKNLLKNSDAFTTANDVGHNKYSAAITLYEEFLEKGCVSEPESDSTPKDEDKIVDSKFYENGKKTMQSLNRIFFGAPGTGKSFGLNNDAEKLILSDEKTKQLSDEQKKEYVAQHLERVTFYPDYTYSQFVGAYKPITVACDGESEDAEQEGKKKQISYEFVPGPFVRILTRALCNPKEDFVLVVEEINRAKAPAVFGDIFQLLDRSSKGVSEYSIQISDEMNKFLAGKKLILKNNLRLPSNLYIWCTMNSADQGVFPLDTAFKRRWDFKYIGINDEEKDIKEKDKYYPIAGGRVKWNDLRVAINDELSRLEVHEDKLLGPFFIKPDTAKDEDFIDLFCNKVLMYLFEDVLKIKRNDFFNVVNTKRFSIVSDKFRKDGLDVFKSENIKKCLKKDNPSGDDKPQSTSEGEGTTEAK